MSKKDNALRIVAPGLLQKEAEDFVMIPSNPHADNLARAHTDITPFAPSEDGEVKIAIGGLEILLKDHHEQAIRLGTRTHKLNMLGLSLLLEQNDWERLRSDPDAIKTSVSFSLDELIEATGAADTARNRKKVAADTQADLYSLESIKLKWRPKSRAGREHDEIRCPVIGGRTGVNRGIVYITYSKDYARAMLSRFVSRLHPNSWRIDARIPSAWPLNIKLHTHYFYDINREKNRHNRLAVKTVLTWLNQIIPPEEDVTDRHYKRRIVGPLEGALNEIKRVGVITWNYCNAKGEELTKDQRNATYTGDYFTIKDLYIHFEILGADRELERDAPRLELKAKNREKESQIKERAKEKALVKHELEKLKTREREAKGTGNRT